MLFVIDYRFSPLPLLTLRVALLLRLPAYLASLAFCRFYYFAFLSALAWLQNRLPSFTNLMIL